MKSKFQASAICKIPAWFVVAVGLLPAGAGEIPPAKHNVGVAGGTIAGSGISYRRWFESGKGYQVTLAPFGKASSEGSEANLGLGITGLWSFYSHPGFKFLNSKQTRSNAFVYYGGNAFGKYRENGYYGEKDSTSVEFDEIHEYGLGLGLGVGFELHIWKMNFSMGTGFRLMGDFARLVEHSRPKIVEKKRTFGTAPSIEAALHIPFGRF